MKTRQEASANYSSIFLNGKTLRLALDSTKPITELRYPEFYDVAINSKCYAKCSFCYTSATNKGTNFSDIIAKINSFFGAMTPNQRPYQVALGGAGEPTLHPDFTRVLEAFVALGIVPNYTTNGMHLSEEVIAATKQYSGGVALSLHRHIEKHWRKGIETLLSNKIRTNVHVILSDKDSIDFLKSIYKDYNGAIDYFVLLPHMNVGFGANNPKQIDYDYLEQFMDCISHFANVAFGSNFWEWLKRMNKWGVSLYPPEIMSKYLIMDDNMKLYNNSFEMKEVSWNNGVILSK